MDFKFICILYFIIVVSLIIIFERYINPYLTKKNIIRDTEAKNKKMELYMKIDPELIDNEIDKLINKYINRYVLYNFTIQKINYIRNEEIDKMVKELDKQILLDLSDLYIFYIKLIINIEDEDKLIKYIHSRVREQVILFTSEFNKPTA